jgi:DNA-binding response OmpR family regulator
MPKETFRVARSRLRGLRVLIVEDSWVISKALQALLEEVGVVIVGPVATAIAAERLTLERAPQVAVVDLKLQDGMAFGLIDRLHKLGVRVVVISGFAPFSTSPVRANAVLQKPCSGPELLATLCDILAGNSSLPAPI